jgi:hypothetical protein
MALTSTDALQLLPKVRAATGSNDLEKLMRGIIDGDFGGIGSVTASADEINVLDSMTSSTAELNALTDMTATTAELNDNDLSARTQAITEAGAINLDARYVTIVGPGASTYAVTLAAPTRAGILKVIWMLSTTSTNAVTLALTNVVGGSQATTATFNAAAETLVLVSGADKWIVLKEVGVTLS